jgi:hypothetical protein
MVCPTRNASLARPFHLPSVRPAWKARLLLLSVRSPAEDQRRALGEQLRSLPNWELQPAVEELAIGKTPMPFRCVTPLELSQLVVSALVHGPMARSGRLPILGNQLIR